jgi:hypothetical protein
MLAELQAEGDSLGTTLGEYTGLRLKERHPRLHQAVIGLLATDSLGIMTIAKLLHVSPNTVMAIRDSEGVAIDTEKTYQASQNLSLARLTGERIRELLLDPTHKEKLRDLAVTLGILTEKGLLLAGEATSRVAFSDKDAGPGHEDYLDRIKTIEAEAELMDLGGETREQKGAAPALPAHRDRADPDLDPDGSPDQAALQPSPGEMKEGDE